MEESNRNNIMIIDKINTIKTIKGWNNNNMVNNRDRIIINNTINNRNKVSLIESMMIIMRKWMKQKEIWVEFY